MQVMSVAYAAAGRMTSNWHSTRFGIKTAG
jgi:hypothetical protein